LEEMNGPCELRRACTVMVSLLDALAEVHAAGIVHNDLKPANLFLNPDDTVRVSDFGGATKIGARGGTSTPRYAAPEGLRGASVTEKTDISSAACIAYELLTGRPCHPTGKHTGDYDPPKKWRPDLPQELVRLLNLGLHRDSNERPASAADFA